ncbi:hypothetical protein GCM10010420_08400 [Streptomyces glaucosporus]|uniref:Peptidase n=1 Tax=Streptomyces glaucosporus TaxID=284044 RepID=A0ABP5UVE1_9ACTN
MAGGGGAEDSRLLDEAFATEIDAGPLWYWPVAMDPAERDYAGCLDWLNGVFAPLGVTGIEVWDGTDGDGNPPSRFAGFRGVYIGGGNTYRLLSAVRRHGLEEPLRRFVADGGAVYGGSAGAALLGADIDTVSHLDEDPYGTDDTGGLDVACGHGVFVHHEQRETPRVQDWARRNGRPVVALHERSGVIVEEGRATVVGFEPVWLVDETGSGVRTLEPGRTVPLGPES